MRKCQASLKKKQLSIDIDGSLDSGIKGGRYLRQNKFMPYWSHGTK